MSDEWLHSFSKGHLISSIHDHCWNYHSSSSNAIWMSMSFEWSWISYVGNTMVAAELPSLQPLGPSNHRNSAISMLEFLKWFVNVWNGSLDRTHSLSGWFQQGRNCTCAWKRDQIYCSLRRQEIPCSWGRLKMFDHSWFYCIHSLSHDLYISPKAANDLLTAGSKKETSLKEKYAWSLTIWSPSIPNEPLTCTTARRIRLQP